MKTSPGNSARPAGAVRRGTGCHDLAPCRGYGPSITFVPRPPSRVAPSPLCTGMERDGSAGRAPPRWDGGGAFPQQAEAGQGPARGTGSPGAGVRRQGIPYSVLPVGAAPAPWYWPGDGRGPPDPALPQGTHLSRWRPARAAEKIPSCN